MSTLHLSSIQLSLPDGAVSATGSMKQSDYLKYSGLLPGNLFIKDYRFNIVDKLDGGIMRIKITLSSDGFTVPLSYQSVIQGLIYSLLDNNIQDSSYNGFVFSGLFGDYSISNGRMKFKNDFYFYISSIDEQFMKDLSQVLHSLDTLMIFNQIVKVKEIKQLYLKSFTGIKEISVKALSPILIYSSTKSFTTYYDLQYANLNDYILTNIENKIELYHADLKNIVFEVTGVKYQKKRMVKFKDCIYPSYLGEMRVKTNYETLQFIYNCGLASKNSCGFGMIEATID